MAAQGHNVAMTFATKNYPQSTRSTSSGSWALDNESSRSDRTDERSWMGSRYRDNADPAMTLTDAQLLKIATEAGQSLHWDTLQQDLLAPATLWKRKQRADGDNVAVYTRTDTVASTYSVVAVSELPCCVQELCEIFSVRSTADYMELMTALWGSEFLYGELLYDVEDPARFLPKELKTQSAELSVRHAAFDRSNVFRRQEEWLYLELLQEQPNSTKKSASFARTLLSLHPDDLFTDQGSEWTHTHRSGSILVGFLFDEEPRGRLTRLRMYAECALDADKTRIRSLSKLKARACGSRSSSQRMVKRRLQQMTQISGSLLKILRRRRLGFQVLVGPKITTLSMISVPKCGRCARSFLMVKQKTCKLCGNIVCDKCSAKHERERSTRTRCCIDSVRVCHRCIVRVDGCKFEGVNKSHLRPARVLSDSFEEHSNVSQRSRGESNAVLSGLLEDSLKTTTTKARRASVIKVINCLVEQDVRDQRSMSAIALTAESSTEQAVQLMKAHLIDVPLPLDQCLLANAETRGYLISPGEDAGASLPAVIPANEQHRLQMVNQLQMKELEARPELSLICALAAKELRCMASMITIVQENSYHVVASSIGSQTGNTLPRHEGFCHQLILDEKPLMVPHVQADVRFSNLRLVKDYNVNFYCGFPLRAEDNTVIGSVCCVDQHSRELTQSQYTALKRLAETASKVVQRNA